MYAERSAAQPAGGGTPQADFTVTVLGGSDVRHAAHWKHRRIVDFSFADNSAEQSVRLWCGWVWFQVKRLLSDYFSDDIFIQKLANSR